MISSVRFNTFAKISQIRCTRDFGLSRAPGLHHEQLIEWRRIASGRALTLGGDLFFDNWCGRALSYSFSTHPGI